MVFTSEGLPHLAEVRVSQTLEIVELRPFSRTLERVIISEYGGDADVDGSADCHFAARPRSSSSSIKGTSAAVAMPFSAIARPAKVPTTSFS